MARDEKLSRQARAARAARAAGIPGRRDLSLRVVDRRRSQLWTTSVFVVAAVTTALVVLSVARDFITDTLQLESFTNWAVLVFVGGLALAFLIYVIEKERSLRRLTNLLFEERVLSTALSNRLVEISALSEVGKAINTTLDVNDVFELILSSALHLLGGNEGSIMLLTPDGTELEVVCAQGAAFEALLHKTEKVGEGVAGTVAVRRTPMLIQGSEIDEELRSDLNPDRPINSSMQVPLIRRGELVGVLNLNETEGRLRFSEEDLGALGLFAEHAAIAIGNARLFEQERLTVSRLEELDRLKSDFVASVSHELKTPLTTIIGAAKTVKRGGHEMPEQELLSFVDMIERQGRRLLRLVEDVLTASRIESGLANARRETFDLGELARLVVDDLLSTKLGEGRTIDIVTEPENPQVWGDALSLRQVLSNLIENALKYSEEPAPVSVAVREVDSTVVIEVTDRGRGIGPDHIKSIFERFRQVESSPNRASGGFGLGLFIVKNIVEQHNGTVGADSTVGVGTTFRVRLPKRARALRGKIDQKSQAVAGGGVPG